MKNGLLFVVVCAAAGCGYNSVRMTPPDDLADGGADALVADDVATADGSIEMDRCAAAIEPDGGEDGGEDGGVDAVADFGYATSFGYPLGNGAPLTHCNDGDGYHVTREFQSDETCAGDDDKGATHLGEDWAAEDRDSMGDPVLSVANGVAVFAAVGHGCWGLVVVVRHIAPPGTPFALPDASSVSEAWTFYAHLERIDVCVGEPVMRGQQIGTIGGGGCFGPHLHHEVIVDPAAELLGPGYSSRALGRVDPSEFLDLNAYE